MLCFLRTGLRSSFLSSEADLTSSTGFKGSNDFLFVVGAAVLIFTYVAVVTFSTNHFRSKMAVSLMGAVAAVLGYCAGAGLCYFVGVEHTSTAAAAPFLVLGIGVDDVFVLINSYSLTFTRTSSKERVMITMRDSGLSITITTLTSLISFTIGATSPYLAIKNFCILTASGLLGGYLMCVTFFLACLSLDARYEERRQQLAPPWCPCCRLPPRQHSGNRGLPGCADSRPEGHKSEESEANACGHHKTYIRSRAQSGFRFSLPYAEEENHLATRHSLLNQHATTVYECVTLQVAMAMTKGWEEYLTRKDHGDVENQLHKGAHQRKISLRAPQRTKKRADAEHPIPTEASREDLKGAKLQHPVSTEKGASTSVTDSSYLAERLDKKLEPNAKARAKAAPKAKARAKAAPKAKAKARFGGAPTAAAKTTAKPKATSKAARMSSKPSKSVVSTGRAPDCELDGSASDACPKRDAQQRGHLQEARVTQTRGCDRRREGTERADGEDESGTGRPQATAQQAARPPTGSGGTSMPSCRLLRHHPVEGSSNSSCTDSRCLSETSANTKGHTDGPTRKAPLRRRKSALTAGPAENRRRPRELVKKNEKKGARGGVRRRAGRGTEVPAARAAGRRKSVAARAGRGRTREKGGESTDTDEEGYEECRTDRTEVEQAGGHALRDQLRKLLSMAQKQHDTNLQREDHREGGTVSAIVPVLQGKAAATVGPGAVVAAALEKQLREAHALDSPPSPEAPQAKARKTAAKRVRMNQRTRRIGQEGDEDSGELKGGSGDPPPGDTKKTSRRPPELVAVTADTKCKEDFERNTSSNSGGADSTAASSKYTAACNSANDMDEVTSEHGSQKLEIREAAVAAPASGSCDRPCNKKLDLLKILNPEDLAEPPGNVGRRLRLVVLRHLGRMILSPWVKLLVLLFFTAMLAVALNGCVRLQRGLDPRYLSPDHSPLRVSQIEDVAYLGYAVTVRASFAVLRNV